MKFLVFLVFVLSGCGAPEFDIKRVKYLIFIGVTYKTSTTEGSFGYFG